MIGHSFGRALTHPAFIDVYFIVLKQYYIVEKREYKMKVRWMHRRHGYFLGDDKLRVSESKYREFKPFTKP